ncbi:uncharacterized protein [Henckelia pumila]|uniref:uncharacterized protein isoform X2 n=1 Tax=Henckelia pumila TaxID=405737 RepID=UPI003C6E5061
MKLFCFFILEVVPLMFQVTGHLSTCTNVGEKAEALKYIPKHADPREKPERERSVKARSILSSHTRIQGMALLPWALSMTHLQKMRILQLYPRNISASIREFRDLVAA